MTTPVAGGRGVMLERWAVGTARLPQWPALPGCYICDVPCCLPWAGGHAIGVGENFECFWTALGRTVTSPDRCTRHTSWTVGLTDSKKAITMDVHISAILMMQQWDRTHGGAFGDISLSVEHFK